MYFVNHRERFSSPRARVFVAAGTIRLEMWSSPSRDFWWMNPKHYVRI